MVLSMLFTFPNQEAYSGRPLRIVDVNREWNKMKEQLKSCNDVLKKYEYLFPVNQFQVLKLRMENFSEKWKEIKALKADYDLDIPKVLNHF